MDNPGRQNESVTDKPYFHYWPLLAIVMFWDWPRSSSRAVLEELTPLVPCLSMRCYLPAGVLPHIALTSLSVPDWWNWGHLYVPWLPRSLGNVLFCFLPLIVEGSKIERSVGISFSELTCSICHDKYQPVSVIFLFNFPNYDIYSYFLLLTAHKPNK